MKVSLPVKLLSVNEAWQGRRFKTNAYKGYEQELLLRLPKKKMTKGDIEIHYTFNVKNMNRDIDNMIKPLQDILVKKGYIEDDRNVVFFTARKWKSDIESFEVEILPV